MSADHHHQRGLALLDRNLGSLRRAPHVLRAMRARYGRGVVNPTALRHLAVFPGLGLAFNRVKKNANSALILLLHEMETGQSAISAVAKDQTPNPFELPPAELDRLDRFAVFTTIRDPYSRVLSAFLDKFRQEAYRQRHGAFDLTPQGFDAFLGWLERGGLKRDPHWNLQSRLLALPLDRYDAVLRFETLREDAAAFLAARGLPLPEGALTGEHRGDQGKQTGAGDRLPDFYTPERARRVARLFAADFAALGYDPDFGSRGA